MIICYDLHGTDIFSLGATNAVVDRAEVRMLGFGVDRYGPTFSCTITNYYLVRDNLSLSLDT